MPIIIVPPKLQSLGKNNSEINKKFTCNDDIKVANDIWSLHLIGFV